MSKKITVLVALLCSLISASQLIYLLIILHSTFYYRGRQRLAQIFASSSQRQTFGLNRESQEDFGSDQGEPVLCGTISWTMVLYQKNERRTVQVKNS